MTAPVVAFASMRRDTGVACDSAQRTVLGARTSDSGACAPALLTPAGG
jgi:hypothetical protein